MSPEFPVSFYRAFPFTVARSHNKNKSESQTAAAAGFIAIIKTQNGAQCFPFLDPDQAGPDEWVAGV
jgi:hypothetical protein